MMVGEGSLTQNSISEEKLGYDEKHNKCTADEDETNRGLTSLHAPRKTVSAKNLGAWTEGNNLFKSHCEEICLYFTFEGFQA